MISMPYISHCNFSQFDIILLYVNVIFHYVIYFLYSSSSYYFTFGDFKFGDILRL